jgi:hypothetical protein
VSGFILGVVIGVLINLITALFSRDKALALIPWLLLYIFIHGAYVLLNGGPVSVFAANMARKYSTNWSYPIVMMMGAILTGLAWRGINSATAKLEQATEARPAVALSTDPKVVSDKIQDQKPIPSPPKITESRGDQPDAAQNKNKATIDRSVIIGSNSPLTNSPITTGDNSPINVDTDWKLTSVQRDEVKSALAGLSATVKIWEISGDRHAHSFAEDIGKLLNGLDEWDAEWANQVLSSAFTGVVIKVSHEDFAAAAEIQRALRSMGIPADGKLDKDLGPHEIHLIIGTKP